MATFFKVTTFFLLALAAGPSVAQQGELLGLEFSLPQNELNLLNNPPSLGAPQPAQPVQQAAPVAPPPQNRFGARLPANTARAPAPNRQFRPVRPARPRPNIPRARPNNQFQQRQNQNQGQNQQNQRQNQVQNRFNRPAVPAPRRPLPTPRQRRPVPARRQPQAPVTPRPRRPITPRPAPATTRAPATTTTARTAKPANEGPFRSIVTYLGTDFILPDGCPLKTCKQFDRTCRRRNFQTEEKYNSCLKGKDAGHMGCVTDVLPTKKTITIPIYANYCSAFCYEKDYEDVEKLDHCPFEGFRHSESAQLF